MYYAKSLNRLRLRIAHFMFALHKKKYHLGWIFTIRYMKKHLEHLQNDLRMAQIYTVKFMPWNRIGARFNHNTLRLQLIAGTNFSVFALRVFGIY